MQCDELAERAPAYLDRTLEQQTCLQLEEHLLRCRRCTKYVARLAHVLIAIDAIRPDDLNAPLRQRLAADGAFVDSVDA